MSKLKFELDKRQMPQIIGLGVLAFGLIGYFSMRLLTPSGPSGAASAAATVGTRSVVKADVRGVVGALSTAQPPDAAADLTGGTAPDAGMRDPFIPIVTDDSAASANPPLKMASALTEPGRLTAVPGLPAAGDPVRPLPAFGTAVPGALAPLAAPIAAPTWTVTGVVAGSDPGPARIAILRQGDVRRFVRLGAMVDEQYRLIDVDRSGVVLGVGKTHFRLPLGGDAPKTAPRVPVANGAASGFLSGSAPTAVPGAATVPTQTGIAAAAPVAVNTSAVPAATGPASPSTNDPATDAFFNAVAAGKEPQ